MEGKPDVPVWVVACAGRKYLMLRWRDPETKAYQQRSAKTNNRRAAERMARELEAAFANGSVLAASITWETFCDRYQSEHLSMLSVGTQKAWRTVRRKIDKLLGIRYLRELDSDAISRLVGILRNGYESKPGVTVPGVRVTSIDSYLGQIAAALSWGKKNRLVAEMPMMPALPRAKGRSKFARARPITLEEMERILLATEKIREKHDDADQWKLFIRGLAASGLRLHELMRLSWDFGEGFWIDQTGKFPVIRVSADAEKAHTDRLQPITQEFWILIQPAKPTGLVLPLLDPDGKPYGKDWVTHVISRIGKKAGVVTSPEDGKCASSHDIGRRFFATRMASKISPHELKAWLRHGTVGTADKFYVRPEAESLAAPFWERDTSCDSDQEAGSA